MQGSYGVHSPHWSGTLIGSAERVSAFRVAENRLLRESQTRILERKMRTLGEQELFAPRPIRHMWNEFLGGKGALHLHLWDVLMIQAWWEQYHAQPAAEGAAARQCVAEPGAPSSGKPSRCLPAHAESCLRCAGRVTETVVPAAPD
jgi:hypothetical protein